MSVKSEIMEAVVLFSGITDGELEKRTGRAHQTVNAECRRLEKEGYLIRKKNPEKDGLIGNYLTEKNFEKPIVNAEKSCDGMSEEMAKQYLNGWLNMNGWETKVAWGKAHGVDIDASKGDLRWLIEVKGAGSRQPMRVNYFISILGKMLQRMDMEEARYSIAFPDMQQYRNLWERLPKLAKERTKIDMILVNENGQIEILK